MSKLFLKDNTAFTLIEMAVYIALIGIVLTGFIAFALSMSGVKVRNYAMEEVNANARMAVDLLLQKIRQAAAVEAPAKGDFGDSLVLRMPDGGTAAFSAPNGVLSMDNGSGIFRLTSGEVVVSGLFFTNLSAAGCKDSIKMVFNIAASGSSREYAYDLNIQTAASPRQ